MHTAPHSSLESSRVHEREEASPDNDHFICGSRHFMNGWSRTSYLKSIESACGNSPTTSSSTSLSFASAISPARSVVTNYSPSVNVKGILSYEQRDY